MTENLIYTGTLVVRRCWCGIRHAIPEELSDEADFNKNLVVYCPVGHEWVSTTQSKREAEKLRETLARERQRHEATRDLLAHEERSHAATKGHLTRTKRRVSAGTCPCCKRTFKQLARHMETQHPDYGKASTDA